MLLVGYVICQITTVLVLPFPDSPRLLLAKGKIEEFKKAMNFFVKWNGGDVIDWDKVDLAGRGSEWKRKSMPLNTVVPMDVAV